MKCSVNFRPNRTMPPKMAMSSNCRLGARVPMGVSASFDIGKLLAVRGEKIDEFFLDEGAPLRQRVLCCGVIVQMHVSLGGACFRACWRLADRRRRRASGHCVQALIVAMCAQEGGVHG